MIVCLFVLGFMVVKAKGLPTPLSFRQTVCGEVLVWLRFLKDNDSSLALSQFKLKLNWLSRNQLMVSQILALDFEVFILYNRKDLAT